MTIYHLLETHAKQNPDAVAITAPDRKPLTYKGLRLQIEETVKNLNSMGIGRNDPVAIVLPNGPEMAVTFLAVASAATCAPLNPAYGANEFDFYLSDLNAKALIIHSDMNSPATRVAQAHNVPIIKLSPIVDAEAGVFKLTGSRKTDSTESSFAQPDDIALVLHTSGTTSRPKIVPLTHANLCASAKNIGLALELTKKDRCLNVMPLFHIHGLMAAVLSSLAAGATVICSPGFDSYKFFEWIELFHPTWYTAVPTMHQAVLQRAELNRDVAASSSLRLIRSSSASLPPKLMAQLEEIFNVPVIESYGMTEASHQMTSNPLPPCERKAGSVGVVAGPDVAIMDEKTNNLLSAGITGEIVIRGTNVTQGYQNNPTANEKAFANGWFRTGDQGFIDSNGYLFITGRLKEIINRGGEKVAPREVDEALMEHPSIGQAVTFAVPHETLGEDVAAAVVLRENRMATEAELREFAFAHLADYKVPTQVLIIDQIPKGPTGKLQRIGLAEKLAYKLKIDFVAPRNQIEETLARLWTEVLSLEQVGINDNFFALDGDSLQATRLVARVRVAFQIELPLTTIFRSPTIVDQARIIEDMVLKAGGKLTEREAQ